MSEENYNFYKKSLRGSGNQVNNTTQPTENAPVAENTQPDQPAQTTKTTQPAQPAQPTENKPNTKINFKFSSLGNLDQTLKKDAKINIDKLLFSSIFGIE
jgi:hypothetical protein